MKSEGGVDTKGLKAVCFSWPGWLSSGCCFPFRILLFSSSLLRGSLRLEQLYGFTLSTHMSFCILNLCINLLAKAFFPQYQVSGTMHGKVMHVLILVITEIFVSIWSQSKL